MNYWEKQGTKKIKSIKAVINPFKLDEVREALTPIGVEELMVSKVKGFSCDNGQTETCRSSIYTMNSLSKAKIKISTSKDVAEQVVGTITKTENQ